MRRIIDLSYPIYHGMPVYPNNPKVEVVKFQSLESKKVNILEVRLGTHTGTHIDVPYHFLADGKTVDQIPLDRFIGEAVVIDVSPKEANEAISLNEFKGFEKEIVTYGKAIIKTGWHKRWKEPSVFFKEFPKLSLEASRWLVEKDIRLLGIDTPSVGEAHRIFLEREVILVEALTNLDEIKKRRIQFIALPLNILKGDGSTTRAIAIEE